MNLQVALVNDYEIVVRGLTEMLRHHSTIEVVEINASAPVASPVDVALVDTFAQAPGPSGWDVESLVCNPLVGRVAVYSWLVEPSLVKDTLSRGAAGYLAKSLDGAALADALAAVHRGQTVISTPRGRARTVEPSAGAWPGQEHRLTGREAEMLALISQGLRNDEIAALTRLSINSVKSYIRSAYRKVGVTSRTHAVLWALGNGFTPDRLRDRPPV